jgi:hypothetical protein
LYHGVEVVVLIPCHGQGSFVMHHFSAWGLEGKLSLQISVVGYVYEGVNTILMHHFALW